jgi:hypothetical protein
MERSERERQSFVSEGPEMLSDIVKSLMMLSHVGLMMAPHSTKACPRPI